MTSRRVRGERRKTPGGRAFPYADRVQRGADRRQVVRRLNELSAQIKDSRERCGCWECDRRKGE